MPFGTKKTFSLLCLLLSLLLVSCERMKEVSYYGKNETVKAQEKYERQVEELRRSLKGDIKIKLKRDGKGNYTWEIQGKDVNEVLKTNEILKKKLSD